MQIVSDSSIFEKQTFNILGIDPGTDTILRSSILTVMIEKVSRFLDEDSFEVQMHSAKYSRLRLISEKFSQVLTVYNPTVVASEAPFFNRFRPNAYAPLVETVFTLQRTLHLWDDYKPLYIIDPPSVKKAVGAQALGQ
jgi:Holliday junction resolvasome RuvABC endonuclease subunit